MKNELVQKLVVFVIVVLILAGIGYGGYTLIIGRDGLVNKITTVESEYDKTEVMEKFLVLVKEKYMAVYNESKTNPEVKLEEAYNTDVAISYFVEKGVLEYYYYSSFDEASKKYTYVYNTEGNVDLQKRDDLFYINVDNIEKVSIYGKGAKFDGEMNVNKKDVFVLEKSGENDSAVYKIKYFGNDGKEDEVGALELANPLIK